MDISGRAKSQNRVGSLYASFLQGYQFQWYDTAFWGQIIRIRVDNPTPLVVDLVGVVRGRLAAVREDWALTVHYSTMENGALRLENLRSGRVIPLGNPGIPAGGLRSTYLEFEPPCEVPSVAYLVAADSADSPTLMFYRLSEGRPRTVLRLDEACRLVSYAPQLGLLILLDDERNVHLVEEHTGQVRARINLISAMMAPGAGGQ